MCAIRGRVCCQLDSQLQHPRFHNAADTLQRSGVIFTLSICFTIARFMSHTHTLTQYEKLTLMDVDDIDFAGQQVLCLAAQMRDKSGGRGNSTSLRLVLGSYCQLLSNITIERTRIGLKVRLMYRVVNY